MTDFIIIKGKLKDLVKGLNVSSDFADALDQKVKELIAQAVERTKANNRRTVMGKDV